MSRNILWTPEAETTFQAQLDYLEQQWPEMSLRKFIDRVFEVINHIEAHPEMYPVYQAEDRIYSCLISPYMVLYYQVEDEHLCLLTFWPIRQDTEKIVI